MKVYCTSARNISPMHILPAFGQVLVPFFLSFQFCFVMATLQVESEEEANFPLTLLGNNSNTNLTSVCRFIWDGLRDENTSVFLIHFTEKKYFYHRFQWSYCESKETPTHCLTCQTVVFLHGLLVHPVTKINKYILCLGKLSTQ